jgi:hypothetical protein
VLYVSLSNVPPGINPSRMLRTPCDEDRMASNSRRSAYRKPSMSAPDSAHGKGKVQGARTDGFLQVERQVFRTFLSLYPFTPASTTRIMSVIYTYRRNPGSIESDHAFAENGCHGGITTPFASLRGHSQTQRCRAEHHLQRADEVGPLSLHLRARN